jgi:hypothetical protein
MHYPYAAGQPRTNDPIIAFSLLGPVAVKTAMHRR